MSAFIKNLKRSDSLWISGKLNGPRPNGPLFASFYHAWVDHTEKCSHVLLVSSILDTSIGLRPVFTRSYRTRRISNSVSDREPTRSRMFMQRSANVSTRRSDFQAGPSLVISSSFPFVSLLLARCEWHTAGATGRGLADDNGRGPSRCTTARCGILRVCLTCPTAWRESSEAISVVVVDVNEVFLGRRSIRKGIKGEG